MSGSTDVRTPRAVAFVLALLTVVTIAGPVAAAPTPPRTYGSSIESLASYVPQRLCSPTAKPGTYAFSRMLLTSYPGTRSLGIVRACGIGGTSEHKEGRAFDWGGLSASRATDRAKVNNLMAWLFATDRHGNRYAMARRLGVQYIVWNKRIWGSYAAGSGWRAYTGSNPHTDHVHFSLSWAGANKTTSYWTGRVTSPAPAPRPPGPAPLPPRITTPPARPASLPAGPAITDETIAYPAKTPGVTTRGALVRGERYLLEVSGSYSWARVAGAQADAECSTTPADRTWRRNRSVHPKVPDVDHFDLYVDGVDIGGEPDVDTGDRCDTTTHTYREEFVPDRSGRVTFRTWDATGYSDNAGGLTIRIIRYVTPEAMAWSVPSNVAVGRTSPGALKAGETYLATVKGTINAGGGVVSDAECSATTVDRVWRLNRSLVRTQPNADHLDVLFNRDDRSGAAAAGADGKCDVATHTYSYVLRPSRTRPMNVRVDDPTPRGNVGALSVRIQRMPRETIVVNSGWTVPVRTARSYPARIPLRMTTSGSYSAGAGVTADAECSRTTTDTTWRPYRSDWRDSTGRLLGDMTIDGRAVSWSPLSGSGRCDAAHRYGVTRTPSSTGRVGLQIADSTPADNSGRVTVTVELG